MSQSKWFLVLSLFLSLSPPSLIINNYSSGFGKGSLFWYMHHLTPTIYASIHASTFSTLSLSGGHMEAHWRSWQRKHTQVSVWKAWAPCNKHLSCVCAMALLTLKECSQVNIQFILNHLSSTKPCDEFWAEMTFFGMTVKPNCQSGSVSFSLQLFSQTFNFNPAH